MLNEIDMETKDVQHACIEEVAKCIDHCGLVKQHVVTHIGQHWFRLWFGACQATIHYLNQS